MILILDGPLSWEWAQVLNMVHSFLMIDWSPVQRHTEATQALVILQHTQVRRHFKPPVGREAKQLCVLQHGDYSKGTKSHYNSTRTTSAKLFSKNFCSHLNLKRQFEQQQQNGNHWPLHNNAHQLLAHTMTRTRHTNQKEMSSAETHKNPSQPKENQLFILRRLSKREVQHGHHMIFSTRITWSPVQIISLPLTDRVTMPDILCCTKAER